MVQGLIGFYYGHFHPGQAVELNRCFHNNMADSPRNSDAECYSPISGHCVDCRLKKLEDIYSVHFTFCGKPASTTFSALFQQRMTVMRDS